MRKNTYFPPKNYVTSSPPSLLGLLLFRWADNGRARIQLIRTGKPGF